MLHDVWFAQLLSQALGQFSSVSLSNFKVVHVNNKSKESANSKQPEARGKINWAPSPETTKTLNEETKGIFFWGLDLDTNKLSHSGTYSKKFGSMKSENNNVCEDIMLGLWHEYVVKVD